MALGWLWGKNSNLPGTYERLDFYVLRGTTRCSQARGPGHHECRQEKSHTEAWVALATAAEQAVMNLTQSTRLAQPLNRGLEPRGEKLLLPAKARTADVTHQTVRHCPLLAT